MFDLCFHFVCRHDSSISFVRNMCIKFARLDYRYTKEVKTLSHVFSLFIKIDICLTRSFFARQHSLQVTVSQRQLATHFASIAPIYLCCIIAI